MAKSRSWIRLYTEVPDNPKLQKLAPDVAWFWVNCLCLAGRSDDGWLPSVDDISWHRRQPRSKTESMLAALIKARLIDEVDGRLRPHDFNERQFEDTPGASRMKAYRERIKSAGRSVNGYAKHRGAIFKRDESKCIYCGAEATCIDHVVPIIEGGDDELENLAAACKGCNSGKAGRTPDEAEYKIREDCAYSALYVSNLERLHIFHERRAEPRTRVTVTPFVTPCDVLPQHCSVSVSVSDSVSELGKGEKSARGPIRAAARFPIDGWAERLYLRHPKKRGKPLVESACLAILEKCRAAGSDPLALFQQIDRVHAPWCASEDWTKENAKYCPQLALWLNDEGWTAGSPAQARAINHGPDTPSEMATWRAEKAERLARGEEY